MDRLKVKQKSKLVFLSEAEIVAIRLSFTTVCIALKEFGLDKESDSYKDCLNIYTVLEKLIKKIDKMKFIGND